MRVVRKKLERKCTQFGETHVMAFTENIEIQWQWQLPNERNLTMIISIYEETSMLQFESRIKKVNGSEEEYMLQLFKLYTAANPTHAEDVTLLAVKRKFMSGISPALRKNIFVFCSDPFAADVTRENLLSFGRQAKNLLSGTENDGGTSDLAGDRVLLATDQRATFDDPTTTNHDGVMAAINNLTLEVSGHVKETEKRFVDIQNTISTISTWK